MVECLTVCVHAALEQSLDFFFFLLARAERLIAFALIP